MKQNIGEIWAPGLPRDGAAMWEFKSHHSRNGVAKTAYLFFYAAVMDKPYMYVKPLSMIKMIVHC